MSGFGQPATRCWSVSNGTAPNWGWQCRPPLPTAKLVVLSLQCCPAPPASRHPGYSPPMMPGVRPLCTRLALSVRPSTWGQADGRGCEHLAPWTFPMLTPSSLTGDVRALPHQWSTSKIPKVSLPDVLCEEG